MRFLGRIVFGICTALQQIPVACCPQYGYRMSKVAMNCAGVTLARDLKDDGVAVGLIHPGAVGVPVRTQLTHTPTGWRAYWGLCYLYSCPAS